MKLNNKTGYIVLISSAVVIFLIVGSFLDMGGESKKENINNNDSITEEASRPVTTPASYEIVESNDISYMGCKRVGIKIIVPDDSKKESVDLAMSNIINAKKSEWQDITVWAYKNSEKEKVGLIGNTMGMKEYSECN